MSEEISFCPYCRENANISVVRNPDYFVRCHTCGANGPLARNEADAIMLHNAAANALDAANAERDALQERCNVYTEQMQTYGRINEYCAKLEGDLYTASWQRDKLAEKLDEAKRIAELRLRDCETMANEVEKYKAERDEAKKIAEFRKEALEAERNILLKHATNLLSQRDEARAWAIKLWREKAMATCPRCEGKGSYVVNGVSKDWQETCMYCNGTGKVTK